MIYRYYNLFPETKARYGIVVQLKDRTKPFMWMPCRSDYINDCLKKYSEQDVYRCYIGFMNHWYRYSDFIKIVKDPLFIEKKIASYNKNC